MKREVKDYRYPLEGSYVVRQHDGSDHIWFDVSPTNLSLQEAAQLWDKKTNGGKDNTKYEDFDYYDIFPAFTVMANG